MSFKERVLGMIHRGKRPDVHIKIILDGPLGSITADEPGGCAYIRVLGIDVASAAKEFMGKSLHWERIKFSVRFMLETEPYRIEMKLDEFRKLLRQ